MKIILNKYPAILFRLNYIYDEKVILIAPSNKAKKFDDSLKNGEHKAKIIFLEDYTLPNLVSSIRNISKEVEIESIITLCEEYIEWAGSLNDHFVEKNTVAVSNVMFKDKFIMRSFLQDVVKQPYFRLLESKKDLEKFWNATNSKIAIIKPREGAACVGIKKIKKNTLLDDSYFDGNYLIEEFINIDKMITCDGFSLGESIKRFFVHDNVELLLESITSKGYYLLRTSELYRDLDLIKKAYSECQKVLKEFSVDKELTPFHFEWFFDNSKKCLVFCEVGKRFGGGDIPDLIEEAYDIDILKEYWQIISSNDNLQDINFSEKINVPKKISATFAAYVQSGLVESIPSLDDLEWASRFYIGLKVGEIVQKADNIINNSMVVRFTSENEDDFNKKLKEINEIHKKIKYFEDVKNL